MSATTGEVVLRDVPGPTALGGGWRRSFDLLLVIAITSFKQTYFGTALGYVWSLARPLMLFAVQLVVFTKIFRLGHSVPHYPVMLLLNIVLMGFFQEATIVSVTSIVAQESIVRKTQFPRLIIPLAVVLTSLFNLGLNMIVVFVFMLVLGVSPLLTWLLLPVLILMLTIITVAVSMIVSSLYPRLRDISIMWTVFSTVLFYATPVLYPIQAVHGVVHDILLLNPLSPIFELARKWMIQPSAPGPAAAAGGYAKLLLPFGIGLAICALGVFIFNREAPRIAEEL